MMNTLFLAAALLLAAGAAAAAPLEKGANLLAFQVTEGTADLVAPGGIGVSAYAHSEIGLQVQYWRFLSDEYAFNLSAGIGTFRETGTPPTATNPDITDLEYTQSSWYARLGGDRLGRVTDRFTVFAGPGLQVWRGKPKYVSGLGPAADWETEATTRFAIHGRIGVMLSWTERVGMTCQLGHYIGYASSAEDEGAKSTWWPSGHDGAAGLTIRF